MTHHVIMDVDTGIDDALALLLAFNHPALEVCGVSCVGGNVDLDQVVRNTLQIADLAAAPDIPICAGVAHPLVGEAVRASHFHGADGLGNAQLPPTTRRADPRHAVEMMREVIEASAEPITIIALAPLTNLATLIQLYPDSARRISRIVWMGGSASVGNVTANAEFNAWHDPEAAHAVIHSGIPLTLYPLEPFYSVAADPETIARLSDSTSAVARAVSRMLAHSSRANVGEERLPAPGSASLGDAGAVCAVIDPAGARTIETAIDIETHGTLTRGQTVIDLRTSRGDVEADPGDAVVPRGMVIRSVNAQRYLSLFLETVCPDS